MIQKNLGNMVDSDHGNNDDDKSHTFRKRRLSLTQRQQESAPAPADQKMSAVAAAAAALASEIDSDSDAEGTSTKAPTETAPVTASAEAEATVPKHPDHVAGCNGVTVGGNDAAGKPTADAVVAVNANAGATANASGDGDGASCTPSAALCSDDEKAHTFRKRRLSLTHRSDDEDSLLGSTSGSVGQNKAKRRHSELSSASASSLNSRSSGGVLRARTLHSGELLSHANYPPSPAINSEQQNILYRNPPRPIPAMPPTADTHAAYGSLNAQQPKWKKRQTRHIDEDERKLPFPRDVVGTFSCHGVEPIYDSDFEHDSDEDDGEWEDDIPRQIVPNQVIKDVGELDPITEDGALPTAMSPDNFTKIKPTTAAKINQDRGGIAFPYGNCARTALFAAYDGHGLGGELVSQFALHEIQSRLEKHPNFGTDIEKAFIDTFLAVDDALKQEPIIEPLYAGTTACVALLREATLTVANAGDSRAVVARRRPLDNNQEEEVLAWDAIDLTVDQNPDMPDEKKRIENMGGFVSPRPEPGLSARVWLDSGFTQIGLAMSRSIGDHAVARVGVIAEPVVSTHDIAPEDDYMIIASDGVWEFLSSQEVVDIVGANISRGATKACQALIEASASRWHDEEGDYRDDITAVVVRLQELWKDSDGKNNNNGDRKKS